MEEQKTEKTLAFHEVETKYRVEGDMVYKFKQLVQNLEGMQEFIYLESDDIYYTNPNAGTDDFAFVRYRFSKSKKDKRAELTIKRKLNKRNNIMRLETNMRVDGNTKEVVESFVNGLGFSYNFKISKIVHIYRLEEVTLPFYTVIDEKGKLNHFIEIEVAEDKLHELTEDQAWAIIEKYEQILAPLGISAKNRVKQSLFEMYQRKES